MIFKVKRVHTDVKFIYSCMRKSTTTPLAKGDITSIGVMPHMFVLEACNALYTYSTRVRVTITVTQKGVQNAALKTARTSAWRDD